MAYKLVKQFDCQAMPGDVCEAFFNATEGLGNDCLAKWAFGEGDILEGAEYEMYRSTVDNWLLANGAVPNDNIVISHWW